ncbi:MAG: inositol monophosphatase [Rhodobacteraceae bacterium]|nr:inositol monophosphatase [Paracoccaceae bacterium]
MDEQLKQRLDAALEICKDAGELALTRFRNLENLKVEKKGVQDLVSEADREVEILIRDKLSQYFPGDGLIGEEFQNKEPENSPYSWIIDPIDGTANFVRGISVWAVVLACVDYRATQIGVVYDPVHEEMFYACRGQGSYKNGKPNIPSLSEGLHDGLVGVGTSTKDAKSNIADVLAELIKRNGIFCRNGSGAISITYVACGRYIGYLESHMNAWDCLAAMLIVEEAGGKVMGLDLPDMITNGGKAIVASPNLVQEIVGLSEHL